MRGDAALLVALVGLARVLDQSWGVALAVGGATVFVLTLLVAR